MLAPLQHQINQLIQNWRKLKKYKSLKNKDHLSESKTSIKWGKGVWVIYFQTKVIKLFVWLQNFFKILFSIFFILCMVHSLSISLSGFYHRYFYNKEGSLKLTLKMIRMLFKFQNLKRVKMKIEENNLRIDFANREKNLIFIFSLWKVIHRGFWGWIKCSDISDI